MLNNEGERLRRVVVSTPAKEYFRVTDLRAQNINEIADPEETLRQHNLLKSIMTSFGTEVMDIPEYPGHPNSVFTRDTSLVTPRGYIQLRMGLEARKGEGKWMAGVLSSLGEPCAGEIQEPGTVEGGDVFLAGDVAFVGLSDRTNEEGVIQISALLGSMGYEVRAVSMKGRFLHIGSTMSVIGPKKVLACADVFPVDFFKGFDVVEAPAMGPSSANVICLGENEVITDGTENAETVGILEKKGVKVHSIDLSEFRKGAGGPSCLILPLERV